MNRHLLAIVTIILLVSTAFAADLGKFGKTYPILEPDGIEEMQNASKRVDWGKYFNRQTMEKKVHDYKPKDIVYLRKAETERVRQIDMSYSLEFDVVDPYTGAVVYPKGYTFNPLDYMVFHKKVVVIDGSDQEQIEWFKKSKYAKDPMTILLITDGVFYEVSEKVKRSVFFLTDEIARRFQFEQVPSVAYQSLKMMEVVEVDVTKEKHN